MKKIIRNAIFIIIFIMCVCGVSYVLQDKSSVNKNKEFFKEKNQFDVLFFGSSHMELFVSPMDLWRDYGFTSYNFGCPEQGLPVTYWVIKNAIDYNKPKMIVVDMHMFNLQGNYSNNEYLHYGLDSFPLTKTKLEAIKEMTNSKEEFLEMIFKIGKYHGNWKNLSESSFRDLDYYMMGNMSYGYYHTMKVTPFEQYPLIDDIAEINEESYIYTKKIIDLCKNEGIELLFVSTPFLCDSNLQMNIHAAEKIAAENDIPYINFVDMNSVIDMQIDMYDMGHVNQSGMHKVTDYIGSYITKNYDVVSHSDDVHYSRWNGLYDNYKQLKYESILREDDLDVTLETLHDENITTYVFIGKNVNLDLNDAEIVLIQNVFRDNIVADKNSSEKFQEQFPLLKLETSIYSQGYLVYNEDGLTEIAGDEAKDAFNAIVLEHEISDDMLAIAVFDKDTHMLKLLRAYTDDKKESDDLFVDIDRIYLR